LVELASGIDVLLDKTQSRGLTDAQIADLYPLIQALESRVKAAKEAHRRVLESRIEVGESLDTDCGRIGLAQNKPKEVITDVNAASEILGEYMDGVQFNRCVSLSVSKLRTELGDKALDAIQDLTAAGLLEEKPGAVRIYHKSI